jgi:hypothetical protein
MKAQLLILPIPWSSVHICSTRRNKPARGNLVARWAQTHASTYTLAKQPDYNSQSQMGKLSTQTLALWTVSLLTSIARVLYLLVSCLGTGLQ